MKSPRSALTVVSLWFLTFGSAVWADSIFTPTAWTKPVPLNGVNTDYHDKAPFLSYDGLTLYFSRQDGPGWHHTRIYQATREKPFGPTLVEEISTLNNPSAHIDYPWVSPDYLRMYYYSASGSSANSRLYVSERQSTDDPWLPGKPISELNWLGGVANPSLTPDELIILFTGTDVPVTEGGFDIWMAKRADRNSPFVEPTNLTSINSSAWDFHPHICADGLTLYFASMRSGTSQLFRATRPELSAPFGPPEHLSFFDRPGSSLQYPFLSSDGTTFLYAMSVDGGAYDIYVSYVPEPSTVLLLGLGLLALMRKNRSD